MNELNIDETYLDVVKPALIKQEEESGTPVMAIKINKKIITGKQTDLLTPAGTLILNAVKYLSKIPDDIFLLSPTILEPMQKLKRDLGVGERLTLSEVFAALSICSVTNPLAAKAMSYLPKLRGCDVHATYIVTDGDRKALKELKINLTCENDFLEDDQYK